MATPDSTALPQNLPPTTPTPFGARQLHHLLHLAGGISHDLNNALTVIRGYAERTLRTTATDDPHRLGAQEILSASSRISALSGHLLAFSPQKANYPLLAEVDSLFGTTVKLLTRFLGEDIEIVAEQEPNLGQVRVRPGHIEQLLIGSAIAARLKIPKGGQLHLKVARSGSWVVFNIDAAPSALALSEEDTLFFSQLALENEGQLHASDALELRLPAHVPPVKTQAPAAKTWNQLPGGSETLLLIEDDSSLLMMSSMALKQLGYNVLQASNPDEALRIAEDKPERIIDLVLTDVVLPKTNGCELASWILASHPEARVLFTSGYPSSGTPNSAIPAGSHFLPKPFSLQELAEAVRAAIER